jgi:hypothetical protein
MQATPASITLSGIINPDSDLVAITSLDQNISDECGIGCVQGQWFVEFNGLTYWQPLSSVATNTDTVTAFLFL